MTTPPVAPTDELHLKDVRVQSGQLGITVIHDGDDWIVRFTHGVEEAFYLCLAEIRNQARTEGYLHCQQEAMVACSKEYNRRRKGDYDDPRGAGIACCEMLIQSLVPPSWGNEEAKP